MGGGPQNQSEFLLIVLPFPEPKNILEKLQQKHPNLAIVKYINTDFTDAPGYHEHPVPDEYWKEATILVTLSSLPPNPPTSCPNLSLIHCISAGTNHISKHPIYTSTDIPLTTSSGIHGPQISEWVIMTALCSSHHYSLLHSWQKQHNWAKGQHERLLNSLRDKTGQRIGILGYGSIGRQVGRVAQAMGMDVVAYTASPRPTADSKKDKGYIVPGTGDPDGTIPSAWYSGLDKPSLHNFLSQDLDFLLVSVPLTKETHRFIGAPEFRILGRPGRNAFISNISRGQIIDQAALVDALRTYVAHDPINGGDGGDGGIRGAALDVTDPEPLPTDDPLWEAPNCIITPHISGLGSTYIDRTMDLFDKNLERREKGEKLLNLVDRKRGY